MISKLLFLSGFLALLLSVSCRKTPLDDGQVIVVSTPPEFVVDLYEQRSEQAGEPQMGLWIESIQTYPCDQPVIEVSAVRQGSTIEVLIAGVRLPEPCLGGAQKARIFVPFGSVEKGHYDIQINVGVNGLIKNQGTLHLEDHNATLEMPNAQAIDIQNYVVTNIPNHYLWGYAGVPNEVSEPAADQLLVDLKKHSTDVALPPGFYSYFSVSGTGQIQLHRSISPNGAHEPFVRQFDGDLQPLRQVIEDARNSPDAPLSIYCQTTLGKI